MNSSEIIGFGEINKIIKETQDYLNENSLEKFHCRCNNFYDFEKQIGKDLSELKSKRPISTNEAQLNQLTNNQYLANNPNSEYYRHRPTQEFLVNCVNLFQNLFDVECYLNVPTKMNEIYYKFGQLQNFKNAIQNIFDAGKN